MKSVTLTGTDFRKKGRRRRPLGNVSELSNLLAALRIERGWTLLDAAKESGLSHRIIAKLEKSRLDTSLSHLESYLKLYGFTLFAKRIGAQPHDAASTSAVDEKGLPKW